MLSHWIVPALAASALALPQQQQQQLRFSPPVADSLAIDLSQAWQGLVHSKPVGFAAEGVRKFSQQVRTDGIDCAYPLVRSVGWGRACTARHLSRPAGRVGR